MALSAGTRLGPYEILAPLGAGGMGEVYRARDSRLGRDVALKILPEDRAFDPDRLRRFETEARTVASLDHPHILALHDVGTHDAVPYVVTELLEGRTLRRVLARGPLPSRKVVDYGVQICRGLAAAHEHGVVHRDLKPENVFLTKDGQIKILDFGLAKLRGPAEEDDSTSSQSPTATEPGLVMGTAGYMSPEQARGRPADARSDIFAAGVVLYEMLSGRQPFRRDTHAETLAAILNEDPPDLTTPSVPVPVGLERIVRRCLEKDPEDRFQSARDVTFALEAVSGTSGVSDPGLRARPWPRTARRWTIPALAFGAVAALLAGVLAGRLWLRPPERTREVRVLRGHIDLTPERPLRSPLWPAARDSPLRNHPCRTELALSPDGTLLVWTSRPDDDPTASALYLRRLDTGEVTRLPGTEGAAQPFFSPDGRWIGFSVVVWEKALASRQLLRKVPVEGGLAVDLAELPLRPMGASWEPDGRIYLGSLDGGIQWVSAEGGRPVAITTPDPAREVGHRLPSVLPGGRTLLFTTMPYKLGVRARIEAVLLASGERKVVVEEAADARYLPTGHLVFVRQGVLLAAPFDHERLELTAPPVPVVEQVSQALNIGGAGVNSGAAQYGVSESGLLVYASGGIFPDRPIEMLLLDEEGRVEPLPGFDRPLVSPQVRYSPDGRQLVFVEQPRSGLLGLFDVHRQTYRIVADRGFAGSAGWSPDGTRLAVQWSDAGPFQLWIVPTRHGDWERLTEGDQEVWAPSWSPDGRFLVFVQVLQGAAKILLYRFEDRQVVPFLSTGAREGWPEFSPDGRWLAYASNESGRDEVYVTSFPDREQTLTVSSLGGVDPAWSRDGRRLFYYSPMSDGGYSMMAVSLRQGPELSLGQPVRLFRLPDGFVALRPIRSYELHPDGRHFVVGRFVKMEPPPPITRLELVHNWHQELLELVPVP